MSYEIHVRMTLTSVSSDPDEVSSKLGIEPDKVWRRGDRIGKSSRRHEDNGWQVSSGQPAASGLENHLRGLIAVLTPATTGLKTLGRDWESELSCAIYIADSAPAVTFGTDVVRFFGALDAAIDIDLYCLDDSARSLSVES